MAQIPLSGWYRPHRAQVRLTVRIVVAALASFGLGHALHLAQSYWAVITAVIVMQASVGGALKATFDRIVGTIGGSIWGVAVLLTVPHGDPASLALALAVVLAPLALLTAFKPAYRVAPITACILLLTPGNHVDGPLMSALNRIFEIGLGSAVALLVSLLVLPARAHGVLASAACQALEGIADLTVLLSGELGQPHDFHAVQALHDRIRKAIGAAEAAAEEANRERRSHLTEAPDPDPLCRTLRRLRNDLVMMGRAVSEPLPEPAVARLAAVSASTGGEIAAFLRASGAAMTKRAPPPSPAAAKLALLNFANAVTDLRAAHITREMPDEAVGRLFGLAFAFDQMGDNLDDLIDRGAEMTKPSAQVAKPPP